jgi:uncharacterized protein
MAELFPALYRETRVMMFVDGENLAVRYGRMPAVAEASRTVVPPSSVAYYRTGKFRLGGDQMVTDAEGNSRISMEDYAMKVLDEAEKPVHVSKRSTIGY